MVTTRTECAGAYHKPATGSIRFPDGSYVCPNVRTDDGRPSGRATESVHQQQFSTSANVTNNVVVTQYMVCDADVYMTSLSVYVM